jgi:hypothetical protein
MPERASVYSVEDAVTGAHLGTVSGACWYDAWMVAIRRFRRTDIVIF